MNASQIKNAIKVLFQYFYNNKTKVTQKFKILDRRSWSRQHFGNTTVFFLRYPKFQPSSVTAVNTGKLYLNTTGNKESLPTGGDWKALTQSQEEDGC